MPKRNANVEDNDSKKFQKLSDREHILARPDMYCGSTSKVSKTIHVMNKKGEIEEKTVNISPAMIQVICEAMMNASDRVSARYEPNSNIQIKTSKIDIDVSEDAQISVLNDGDGIPCEYIEKYKMYAPELIFGHLRTSSNYDDNEQRLNVGRNGVGIKTTNIFSKNMSIETVDTNNMKKYKQTFSDNMSVINKPKITTVKSGNPYTKVSFDLDMVKFGGKDGQMDKNVTDLMRLKAHEISMCSLDKIKVRFNKDIVKTDSAEKYMSLFGIEKSKIVSHSNDRWKVAIAFTPNEGFRQFSFVNSTFTAMGGTHVNHVLDPLMKSMVDSVKKKYKVSRVRSSTIKDNLTVVISAHVVNPTFSSQSKELLTLNPKDFGSSFEVPESFSTKLLKSGLMNHIGDLLKDKESSTLKDSDGKKSSTVKGISKLHDAKFAGTKKSEECTLILTEGDSALTMVLSAMSVIGRDKFGAFPLRGKLLNVRDASPAVVSGNTEITSLKKILGLQAGNDYKDTSNLRYGSVVVLTDADVDGIHIRGLILNLFEVFWPSLLKLGYVKTLYTPIVRVTKGTNVKLFYNEHQYLEWKESVKSTSSYKIKYLKGLGSSTSSEAKEYFKDVHNTLVEYLPDNRSKESMKLAFDKKMASERKDWLTEYNKDGVLDTSDKSVGISDFIDSELIHFSMSDIQRSIPSVVDGFKISQRKALFGCIKKGIVNNEAKVAQICGYISDVSQYHHGEASMNGTIISMAQDFVGSNNINLLLPKGQLGSRLEGGKDSASPRYVFVQMSEITQKIFRKEDEFVLSYMEEDGNPVEPCNYVPVICMTLVNGSQGIGTGFSTSIPQYNPVDIIENVKNKLNNRPTKKLTPFYRGFKGRIVEKEDGVFNVDGVFSITDCTKGKKVTIRELPVGTWSIPYKKYLEGLVEKKQILSYQEACTDTIVDFEVIFDSETFDRENLVSLLKLSSTIRTSNMHCFDANGKIKKYETTCDIENAHFEERMNLYSKRKNFHIKVLTHELKILKEKCRFFDSRLNGTIVLEGQKLEDVIQNLKNINFKELGKTFDDQNKSFDYITNIKIFDVTSEKMEKLVNEKEKTEKELEYMENISIESMYMNDLLDLEKNI